MYKEVKLKGGMNQGHNYLILYRYGDFNESHNEMGEINIHSENIIGKFYRRCIIRYDEDDRSYVMSFDGFQSNDVLNIVRIEDYLKPVSKIYEVQTKEDIEEILDKELMLIELKK